MKVVNKKEANASLAAYVEDIRPDDSIVITEEGKPIAILFPIDDMDLESLSLSTNPAFLAIIQRARLRDQSEGRLSQDAVRELFNKKE